MVKPGSILDLWIQIENHKSNPDPQHCFFMKLIVSVGAAAPYSMLRTLPR
jgi:hypothetical protein